MMHRVVIYMQHEDRTVEQSKKKKILCGRVSTISTLTLPSSAVCIRW